jgi:hypothetical protein
MRHVGELVGLRSGLSCVAQDGHSCWRGQCSGAGVQARARGGSCDDSGKRLSGVVMRARTRRGIVSVRWTALGGGEAHVK